MTSINTIDGSFKYKWGQNDNGWNSYLRCWIEEPAIGGLEFTLANEGSGLSSLNALVQFPVLLVGAETEGVHPVWAREELSLSGICLHVLPTGMRPSAWDELEVLFRHSSLLLFAWVIVATRTHGPSPGLIASAVVHDVIAAILFCAVFHCCLSIYENLH